LSAGTISCYLKKHNIAILEVSEGGGSQPRLNSRGEAYDCLILASSAFFYARGNLITKHEEIGDLKELTHSKQKSTEVTVESAYRKPEALTIALSL